MAAQQKKRLDLLLVDKELVPTRSKARDMIKRGEVYVDGQLATKPGQLWAGDVSLTLSSDARQYVSRGGLKLKAALDYFELDAGGRTCLDIGTSTGGFAEVLLSEGAALVYGIDIGSNQLHPALKDNPKLTSFEKTDARDIDQNLIPAPIEAITVDLSFISVTKVLDKILPLTTPGAWIVCLIKPQFELEKKAIGKGGIVRDKLDRARAVKTVHDWFNEQDGWHVLGILASPIRGQNGNQEYLLTAGRED